MPDDCDADPPYTFTIYYLLDAQSINYMNSGICIRDSASGKLTQWGYTFNTTNNIAANNYTSPTAFSGSPGTSQWSTAGVWTPAFIRLVDDGTNFTFKN